MCGLDKYTVYIRYMSKKSLKSQRWNHKGEQNDWILHFQKSVFSLVSQDLKNIKRFSLKGIVRVASVAHKPLHIEHVLH